MNEARCPWAPRFVFMSQSPTSFYVAQYEYRVYKTKEARYQSEPSPALRLGLEPRTL